jgi:multidrug resistance efflux pump
MESTEKKRRGKSVVIGMLLLATIGAGLTWLRYTAQAPSTANARLVADRLVLARFDSHAARNIREGSKAIVTFESSAGKRLAGVVQSLQIDASETKTLILLKEVPQDAKPQTPCSVTVDTSVPQERTKLD